MGLFRKTPEEKARAKQEELNHKLLRRAHTWEHLAPGMSGITTTVERSAEKMRSFLEQGADPNFVTQDWGAAIHLSAGDNFVEGIQVLLEHKAVIDLPNLEGRTALHIAASLGLTKIVDFLVANGADPDITDKNNNTAADLAEVNGYSGIARQLREYARVRSANDNWALVMADTVSHVYEDLQNGVRLAEIFNFKSKTRHYITYRADGGVMSQNVESFEDVHENAICSSVATAEAKLKKLGGIVPQI